MNNDSTYNLNESLGFLVGHLSRLMGSRLNDRFREAGHQVTREQWMVLTQLWNSDGSNQQDLALGCSRDKTSITRIIDSLEKLGYVVRIPDQNDRRNKRIHLTQPGRELQSALMEQAYKTREEAETGIDTAEMEACKNVLRQIIETLENKG